MDNDHGSFSEQNDSCNEVPASSGYTNSSNLKSEKIEPIFRIIEAYDKRNVKTDKDRKAEADFLTSNTSSEEVSRRRGDLYADEKGPIWHKISSSMITRPIFAANLPLQFKDLPIFGAPECAAKLEDYENQRIREFVGFDLEDTEFEELRNYCNPENLKTGKELKMVKSYPITTMMSKNLLKDIDSDDETSDAIQSAKTELCILKRTRKRQKAGNLSWPSLNAFSKLLKYRGMKQFPLREQEDGIPGMNLEPPDLEPGRDVLYRIRVYRPYSSQTMGGKQVRGRHSVFHSDIVIPGRQPLTALRDRFSCRNDLDMRVDRSHNPDENSIASAKSGDAVEVIGGQQQVIKKKVIIAIMTSPAGLDGSPASAAYSRNYAAELRPVMFPSGFLFINNVFYVDTRDGCRDTSAPVRRWAAQRGLGVFTVRSMDSCCLDDTLVRIAHPEVYVHQGYCEHVFLFSEIRLLNRSDPLHLSAYPCHTLMSQNQSIYCTTCAEYGAKWLVTGSDRVPFDPAFFCDICFKHYLYIDGQKVGNFKAYAYRGNELNVKNPGVSDHPS